MVPTSEVKRNELAGVSNSNNRRSPFFPTGTLETFWRHSDPVDAETASARASASPLAYKAHGETSRWTDQNVSFIPN